MFRKFIILVIFINIILISFCMKVAASINDKNLIIEECIYKNETLEMAYLMYLPRDYNSNNKYRLVLFMHGAGDRGFDFSALRKIDYGFVSKYSNNSEYYSDTILLVPQCPVPYLWIEADWGSGSYIMTNEESPAIKAVKELLDNVVINFNIDKTRMYAVGVSMGGMAVWDLIGRYPGYFAAAAPICGCLDPSKINEYSKTPIFTANDKRDTIINANPTIEVVNKLKTMNADIVYKEYDTSIRNDKTYHSTWIDAYELDQSDDNLYNFIFSHQKNELCVLDKINNNKIILLLLISLLCIGLTYISFDKKLCVKDDSN